jgi:hypothetical protein
MTGGANLGLTTKTSIEGNPAFPAFSFDLAANFPVFNYGTINRKHQKPGQISS